MDQNPQSSTRHALWIGGSAIAITGLGILTWNLFRKRDKIEQIVPTEVVITVLKEVRREFYPLMSSVSQMAKITRAQFQRSAKGARMNPKMEEFMGKSIAESPQFAQKFKEAEEAIYAKHAIENPKQFEAFCHQLRVINPEINQLMNEIRDNYRTCLEGGQLKFAFEMPPAITSEQTLRAQKDIYKATLKHLLTTLNNNPDMNEEDLASQQKEMEKITLNALVANGFDISPEWHPQTIFEKSLARASTEDFQTKKKLSMLTQIYSRILQSAMSGASNINKLLKDVDLLDTILEPEAPTGKMTLTMDRTRSEGARIIGRDPAKAIELEKKMNEINQDEEDEYEDIEDEGDKGEGSSKHHNGEGDKSDNSRKESAAKEEDAKEKVDEDMKKTLGESNVQKAAEEHKEEQKEGNTDKKEKGNLGLSEVAEGKEEGKKSDVAYQFKN